MRILYIESDPLRASQLSAGLPAKRGVRWDLVLCSTLVEARERIDQDHFDACLLSLVDLQSRDEEYEAFVTTDHQLPLVLLVPPELAADGIRLVRQGAADCIVESPKSAPTIIRRLRLAATREMRGALEARLALALPVGGGGSDADARIAEQTSDVPKNDQADPPDHEQLARGLAKTANNMHWSPDRVISLVLVQHHDSSSLLGPAPTSGTHPSLLRIAATTWQGLEQFRDEHHGKVDAVLIPQSLVDRLGTGLTGQIKSLVGNVATVALMSDKSETAAVACVEQGIDDCLPQDETNWNEVERAVRLAWARKARLAERASQKLPPPSISDRREQARGDLDRRGGARYLITRPLLAIPLLPNGRPGTANICEGFTLDLSLHGAAFQMASRQVLPTRQWVIGMEQPQRGHGPLAWHYASVTVHDTCYTPGGIQLRTEIIPPHEDPLRAEQIQPTLQPHSFRLLPSLPAATLEEWVEVGVLRRGLVQRVKSCPECSAIALVSDGCIQCGSGQIAFQELIHHFSCAYVGAADEFQTGDSFGCPKCLVKGLVVGADFEVMRAAYSCPQCGHHGSELEQVGSCPQCQLRFPLRMARECEVHGYDVDRLDILALLNSAT